MRTMNRILLLAGWVLGATASLSAQDPFGAVAPTGKSYTIVVSSALLNGTSIPGGAWIAAFDGSRAVGSAQFQGTWPMAITAWQGDAGQGLDGFTSGNSITFKIRTAYFDTTMTLDATSVFDQGDGRFGTGAFSAVRLSASTPRVPILNRVGEGGLDFGSVRIGQEAIRIVTLRNTGRAILTFTSITFQPSDYLSTMTVTSLNPGTSVDLPVVFRPASALPISGEMVIRSDDPANPEIRISLNGQGLPRLAPQLTIDPGSVSFGPVPTGSYSIQTVTLRNTGTDTLKIQSMSASTSEFVLSRSSATIAPGSFQAYTIRFQPSASGTRSATLQIQSNLPSGVVTQPLTGVGYTSAFGTVIPTGQSYNVVVEGIQVDRLPLVNGDEVALYAEDRLVGQTLFTGSWPLTIAAWQASTDPVLPGFNPGEPIRIRTNPIRFGARESVWLDSLTWSQGDGTYGNGVFAAVTASGFSGRAPTMEVTSSALVFGNVRTGSTSDLSIWVRNSGATTLQLTLQTSAPFSVIGNTTRSIHGGDSLNIGIRYSPTTAMEHRGVLRIESNDPFHGPTELPLSGRGLVTVPDSPVVFEISPTPLMGLPIGRWTDVDVRLRNPFSMTTSGRLEVRTGLEGVDAADLPSSVTIPADDDIQIRFRLRSTTPGSDTLRFVWVDANGGETVFRQFALAYHSLFEPVIETGSPYTIVVKQVSTVGQALSIGDEIGVFDGTQLVGHGLWRGPNQPVAITAWQADPSRNLPGFTPGNPILFKVAKSARGYQGKQLLHSRSVTFDGAGRFGQGAFEGATVTINEPLFWFSRLRDTGIVADSFTSKIWARLDTLVVDPDAGAIQFSVSTDQAGLSASIVNARIVLTLQSGYVGPVMLTLRAQEGPYVLQDSIRITVFGRLTVQRSLGSQKAYPSIEVPVLLTGANGLYGYPDPDALTVSLTSESGGFSHRRSGDTLYVNATELGTHSLTLRVNEPGGQFHTQTVSWLVREFDPTEGLTRYLPFNGNFDGATVLGGVSLDRDRFEYRQKSMLLDGIDQLDTPRGVTLFNPLSLDVNSEFTLSIWFATDGEKSSQTILNTIPHTYLNLSVNHFHRLGSTNLSMFAGDGNGWRLDGASVPTFQFDNQRWNHAVLVRKGEITRLYLNGELLYEVSLAGLSGRFELRLGSTGVISGETFDGSLDEFRVYSRAFEPWEVTYLYNSEELAPQNAVDFAGGNGTSVDPYRVGTASHLDNVRHFPSAFFRQTQDINLGLAPWNSHEGWMPIGDESLPFMGTYDGGNRSIRNLTITRPTAPNQGLFGVLERGSVLTNLALLDANIDAGSVSGSMIGSANGARISNVHSSDLVMTSDGATIGGLIGRMIDSELSDSYATGSLSGGSIVGGLVGETHSSTMSNAISTSYSVVDVSGISDVGAFIGIAGPPNSRNAVILTSGGPGLVGSGSISGISGFSDTQMRNRLTFQNLGWNLQDTWDMFDTSYPYLKSLRPLQLPGKEYDWIISASVRLAGRESNLARFGMNSGATDGYDSSIEQAIIPPPPREYLSVHFNRPDWGAPLGPNFNADIRAPRELGMRTEIWQLHVQTDFAGPGQLTLDYPDGFSGPMSVRYGDSLKTGSSDMTVDFLSVGSQSIVFTIEVGDRTPPVIVPGSGLNGPRIYGSGVIRRLDWSVTDENEVDRVKLSYRLGSVAEWIHILEQRIESVDWTTPGVTGILDSLQFRLVAYDRSGNSAEWITNQHITVSTRELTSDFPIGWSLRSIPLNTPRLTQSGQAFRFAWNQTEYVTLSSPGFGMGYWNGATTSGSANFTGIVLEESAQLPQVLGWNLVGSPLTRRVDVDSVLVTLGSGPALSFQTAVNEGWLVGPLSFEEGAYQLTSIMSPFDGYWIGSTRSDVTLHLPIHALDGPTSAQKTEAISAVILDVLDSGTSHRLSVRNEPAIPIPPSAPSMNRIGLRGETSPLGSLYLSIRIDSTTNRSYPMVVEGISRDLELTWPNQSISGVLTTLVVNDVTYDLNSSNSLIVKSSDRIALNVSPISTSTEPLSETPQRTELHAAYPNPFNPSTQIRYTLDAGRQTRLAVYDLLGRQVAVLVNGTMPAGRHQVTFDASGLASGVYLVRMEAGGEMFTRRMTLLK